MPEKSRGLNSPVPTLAIVYLYRIPSQKSAFAGPSLVSFRIGLTTCACVVMPALNSAASAITDVIVPSFAVVPVTLMVRVVPGRVGGALLAVGLPFAVPADHRLPDRLAAIPHGDSAPQIYLRADRGLDYGRVMTVMGELSRAGLTKVSLVTNGGATSTNTPAPAPVSTTVFTGAAQTR